MATFGRLLAFAVARAMMDDALDKGLEDENIMIPVSSTCIVMIGYQTGDVITVVFRRGGAYQYAGSKELFEAFVAAPSKGQFFNANFR